MLPSSAFYECITGSILIIYLQGINMAKKKFKIRVNAQFDLEVSEEYLAKLQKYDFKWAIFENCFRTNKMENVTANMEVLENAISN